MPYLYGSVWVSIRVSPAIPVMDVNEYKRGLVHLPFRKHFRILRTSTRHVLR